MKTLNLLKEKNFYISKGSLFTLALAIVFSASCTHDDPSAAPDAEDSETALFDSQEDYYSDDADDVAFSILEQEDAITSKTSTDSRLACAAVTRSGSTEAGSVSVNFGMGCTDARGNIRKGSIVVMYSGRWNIPGSSWTVRFENYSVNNITIAGMRTVTNISESTVGIQSFRVDLEDGFITWPDGSIARRRLHHRREAHRDGNNILNRLIIYGTAEGNHRNGRGFYIEILEPLVYDRRCAVEGTIIPVSGKKLIKHGDREITVDYGDGACDNFVTITNKNGRTWRYEVKK
jgi:hypothetical protein